MIGVEAGGSGPETGKHAARFATTEATEAATGIRVGLGVLHGTKSYLLQTEDGQIAEEGVKILSELEGIIPALESAHAIAEVVKRAPTMSKDELIIVNLSGRGDKDLETIIRELGDQI